MSKILNDYLLDLKEMMNIILASWCKIPKDTCRHWRTNNSKYWDPRNHQAHKPHKLFSSLQCKQNSVKSEWKNVFENTKILLGGAQPASVQGQEMMWWRWWVRHVRLPGAWETCWSCSCCRTCRRRCWGGARDRAARWPHGRVCCVGRRRPSPTWIRYA